MDSTKAYFEAMEWLEKFDLGNRAKDKLQTLSKGNQQKVQFIASIIHKPDFAILDEPFSGLDPINQEKFLEHIKELNKRGTTILISSHQMLLIEKIADSLFFINHGREVYNGSLSDVLRKSGNGLVVDVAFRDSIKDERLKSIINLLDIHRYNDEKVRLTFESNAELNSVLTSLSHVGNIENIKSEMPNLHEIFINLLHKQTEQ
jgi:ABC-2 type transport system ATP-binding protein